MLVTPQFIVPRGVWEEKKKGQSFSLSLFLSLSLSLSLSCEDCELRNDELSCWLMYARQRQAAQVSQESHVSSSRIIVAVTTLRVACDRRERDLHTTEGTLRNVLGRDGDVATRDNTPRDTVSHSMLRLRIDAHESGFLARLGVRSTWQSAS